MNYMFDIETLGIDSTCVILSAAIIHFEQEEELDMDMLRERALFVKFNIQEQVEELKRSTTKSTIDWWKEQPEYARKKSLPAKASDVDTVDGIEKLRAYINKHQPDPKKITIWARGSLDQMAIDSLARAAGLEHIAPYYVWRDVRTAVDIVYGSTNGYCKVPSVPRDTVLKHDPVDDCALDIMMLCRGEAVN
jgi:hypothetical protein